MENYDFETKIKKISYYPSYANFESTNFIIQKLFLSHNFANSFYCQNNSLEGKKMCNKFYKRYPFFNL